VSSDPLLRFVEAAIEGDDVALAELVRQTQPAVWRLCTALGSTGEVEDLVQETYERALKALPAFRGDAPVQMWLLGIGRRVCADHVRRRQRQRRLMARLSLYGAESSTAVDEPTDDLLHVLDADRREAFFLTQVLGLSYEEAASVIGCPIGTVRSRVSRARSDLLAAVRRSEAQ
jgi:RNA polymerase sigma-70 factor (ECF subfamily)